MSAKKSGKSQGTDCSNIISWEQETPYVTLVPHLTSRVIFCTEFAGQKTIHGKFYLSPPSPLSELWMQNQVTSRVGGRSIGWIEYFLNIWTHSPTTHQFLSRTFIFFQSSFGKMISFNIYSPGFSSDRSSRNQATFQKRIWGDLPPIVYYQYCCQPLHCGPILWG